MESLESRHVLSAVTVTVFNDDVNGDTSSIASLLASDGGDGVSLREAILAANATPGADSIGFSEGGTITLTGGELTLTDNDLTTIEGNDRVTVDADGQTIAFVIDTGAAAALRGLTITGGGFASYPVGSFTNGAGIFNDGTLEVRRSNVTGNTANDGGGGIANWTDGVLTVIDSVISNNSATNTGGGIRNDGVMLIIESTISGNSAGDGGGISSGVAFDAMIPTDDIPDLPDFGVDGNVTIVGTTITSNTATENGGGIINTSGVMRIHNSTIAGNQAIGSSIPGFLSSGGGIATFDDILVDNTTISGNTSTLGGGVSIADGDAYFLNSTISTNTATTPGAAAVGGGLFVSAGGVAELTNSTVFGNITNAFALTSAGGIFHIGDLTLNNTVVAGHTAFDLSGGGAVTGAFNLIEDGQNLGALTNTRTGDPGLGPLADNGGDTLTHAPLPGSQLLNTGDNNLAITPIGAPVETDQGGPGFTRIFSNVDIGSVEAQDPLDLVVTTTDDVVALDGQVSLREAISRAGNSDVITFADELGAATVNVTQGEFSFSGITIDGGGDITLDAGGASRLFNFDGDAPVELRGLTLTGGNENAGGAISMRFGAKLTIVDSLLTGNTAEAGGAIYHSFIGDGFLRVINSTISNNTATNFFGGGVRTGGNFAEFVNSTITGNTVLVANGSGGGLDISSNVRVTITNSTITGNTADNGAGIYANRAVTLNNTVVAGNVNGNDLSQSGSQFSGSNNFIGDNSLSGSFTNSSSGDAMLGPLADNGGPTPTHEPMAGSPLINAGSDALALGVGAQPLTTDQRGEPFTRFDGTVDIGSIERRPDPASGLVVTDTGDQVNAFDGVLTLREAVARANATTGSAETITFDPSLAGETIELDFPLGLRDADPFSLLTIDGGGVITLAAPNTTTAIAATEGNYEIRGLTIEDVGANRNDPENVIAVVYAVGFIGGPAPNPNGEMTIRDTTVRGVNGKAIENQDGGNLSIIGSAIHDNTSVDDAAVNNLTGSVMVITSSTISGNTGEDAGAIENIGALTIRNSTVFDNDATAGGGGILNDLGGTLTLDSTIVAGNALGDIVDQGGTLSGSNNLIQDGSLANSFTNTVIADPLLGALADNGGPTQTHLPDPLSPAENQGSNPLNLAFDQRGFGFPRGAGHLGQTAPTFVDIGAVEVPDQDPAGLVVTTDQDVFADDGELSLREAVFRASNRFNGSETITFADELGAATLVLGGSEISLADFETLTIDGGGDITIDANGQSRAFNVPSGRSAKLTNLSITNGSNGSFGGGVYNGGSLELDRVTITGSQANRGGGVGNFGSLNVVDSTISGNNATAAGGGVSNGGQFILFASTVSGNTAGFGGGVYQSSSGGYTAISGGTISGNQATSGGGGLDVNRTVSVFSSTIVGNTAPNGGGINNYANLTLNNTVVAGGSGAHVRNIGGTLSGSNNLIEDGGNAGAFAATLTGDPMLEPLADNGGPTLTHRPIVGSPLVGAGTNGTITIDFFDRNNNGVTSEDDPFDQRGEGFDRVIGANVDIGAVELKLEAFDDVFPSVVEDTGPYELDVLANDLDPDGNAVISAVTNVLPAGVQVDFTDDLVTVTTPQDFNGEVTFEYTTTSPTAGSDTATATLVVTPVNDDPTALDDFVEAFANTPILIDVLANDSDVDGDTTTLTAIGTPLRGAAEIVGDQVLYTPMRFFGNDTFTYTIIDGAGGMATGTVSITQGVETISFFEGIDGYAGTHDADPWAIDPDETRNRDRSGVDSDVRGFPNTGRAVHGLTRFDNIIGSGTGQIPQGAVIVSATLNLNVFDPGDIIEYWDLTQTFDEATTTWNSFGGGVIPGVNATTDLSPIFDGASGVRSVDVTSSVQSWANGATNHGWGFTMVDAPEFPNANGDNGADWHSSEAGVSVRPKLRVVIQAGMIQQELTFRDGENGYAGTQDVTLSQVQPDTVLNGVGVNVDGETGLGGGAFFKPNHSLLRFDDLFGDAVGEIPVGSEIVSATVKLELTEGGDNVNVRRLTVPFDEETVTWNNLGGGLIQGVNTTGVVGSFSGAAGIRNVNVTSSLQAWVNGEENLGWGFTPSGDDDVEWISSEGFGTRPTLTVQYREPGRLLNEAPIAGDDEASTGEDQAVVIDVLSDDSDPEDDTLTVVAVTQPSNGMAVINPDGTITYTPAMDFNGQDTFTYDISDGTNDPVTATVTVTVNQVNDPGVFSGDVSGSGDDFDRITGQLTFTDDADGATASSLRIEAADQPTNGVASITAEGWRYNANSGFQGTDSFVVSVTDDDGNIETQQITVTVNGLPAVNPDFVSTAEDQSITIDVLQNDSDPGDDPLTVTDVTQPSEGMVVINPDGTITYTPLPDFNGFETFEYEVSDDRGGVVTSFVEVTVNQVNDPGVFGGDTSGNGRRLGPPVTGALTFEDSADGVRTPDYRIETGDEPANGQASIDPVTGEWTYTGDATFEGADGFTVSVTDNDGNVETQLISVAIDPIGPLQADFNVDGKVDLLDLDILGMNFNGPGDFSMGDANGDGVVDLIDLDILGQNFGNTAPASPPPALVQNETNLDEALALHSTKPIKTPSGPLLERESPASIVDDDTLLLLAVETVLEEEEAVASDLKRKSDEAFDEPLDLELDVY